MHLEQESDLYRKKKKSLNEVKPVENINKNLQSFVGVIPVQKDHRMECKTMHMSNRI